MTRIETADETLTRGEFALKSRLSQRGDADMYQAFTDLSELTSSIERAIQVARTTFTADFNRFG